MRKRWALCMWSCTHLRPPPLPLLQPDHRRGRCCHPCLPSIGIPIQNRLLSRQRCAGVMAAPPSTTCSARSFIFSRAVLRWPLEKCFRLRTCRDDNSSRQQVGPQIHRDGPEFSSWPSSLAVWQFGMPTTRSIVATYIS